MNRTEKIKKKLREIEAKKIQNPLSQEDKKHNEKVEIELHIMITRFINSMHCGKSKKFFDEL